MYLPDNDWIAFKEALEKVHASDTDQPICSYFGNNCYFDKPCAELKESNNHFHINIQDDNGNLDFDIDEKELRIDAS